MFKGNISTKFNRQGITTLKVTEGRGNSFIQSYFFRVFFFARGLEMLKTSNLVVLDNSIKK